MEVTFTEVTNHGDNINKKILTDGSKEASANVRYAAGKTMKVKLDNLAEYLESLNNEPKKALVLGVSGLDDFTIRLKGKENLEKQVISRSKEYFNYCNSDTVGLMYFDIDGNSAHGQWTEDEVGDFVAGLEKVLAGALIGKEGSSRTTLCRFVKDSSTAGVVNGNGDRLGSGIHVYFPVRNPDPVLIELIYKWAWLYGWKSHLIDKAGGLHIRTIIDVAVKDPERLIFESDCSLEAPENFKLLIRECSYVPGGVLDSELAIALLDDMIGKQFEIESKKYIENLRKTPEVVRAVQEYEAKAVERLEARGIGKVAAKKAVRNRRAGILLSSDFLIRDDMSEVSVLDVLLNRGEWEGAGGFRPPLEPEYGAGKAKIFVNDSNVILNCFAHGGETYELKFDYQGISKWLEKADEDELEELFPEFIAQAELSETQSAKVFGIVSRKVGATKKAVETDVKEKREEIREEAAATACDPESGIDVSELETQVDEDATHIQIADAVLCNYPNYVVFGKDLYTFERTIWKKSSSGSIQSLIGYRYGHCNLCRTASHYKQLMDLMLEICQNRVSEWKQAIGFPCSNSFWHVDVENKVIEDTEYRKELNARFKMGFEPDFEMKMPYWDRVLRNVVNPGCLQKVIGLALSGLLTTHCQEVGIFKGPGGVGKGTVSRVLAAMLPPGRVTNVSIQEMNIRKQVWQLRDSAINLIPEITTKRDRKIDLTGFKQVTGGDVVNGEQKYQDAYPFVNNAPNIISMNQWPTISAFGSEVARRMQDTIVEFQHNHDDRIERLDEKVIQYELPGVLAWAMEGVQKWFAEGSRNAHSRELFKKWSRSVDGVVSFLEDECETGKRLKVSRPGVYAAYKYYCTEGSLEMEGRNEFFLKLEEKYEVKKIQGERYFMGLGMKV